MTVCESDSGLCWDLDEETLARAILTFCLNTADALMTALLKGTADAWEALTLIRDCARRPARGRSSSRRSASA
jgi:DNA processing protein